MLRMKKMLVTLNHKKMALMILTKKTRREMMRKAVEKWRLRQRGSAWAKMIRMITMMVERTMRDHQRGSQMVRLSWSGSPPSNPFSMPSIHLLTMLGRIGGEFGCLSSPFLYYHRVNFHFQSRYKLLGYSFKTLLVNFYYQCKHMCFLGYWCLLS